MYRNSIKISDVAAGHVQGIAIDKKREYMYFSFTTLFVKADMNGNVVGSVRGLAGHLGCIAYNYDDGRVYGSLEYKRDSIGAGIRKYLCDREDLDNRDGFYVAAFDVEKIDKTDMDAEKDGVMTTVHLSEVLGDYEADGHRFGCSGIDGLTFAPKPGETGGKKYLYVAYGIYGDVDRDDNDCQVILRYDTDDLRRYETPLCQSEIHRNGPDKYQSKYFVYTGNTTYGIQNLEYDENSGLMFAAVYRGSKAQFPNYPMFVIDMNKAAVSDEKEYLSLAEIGCKHEASGVYGIEFPYGSTGIISLGDGYFYFSEDFKCENGYGTEVKLYRFDEKDGFVQA